MYDSAWYLLRADTDHPEDREVVTSGDPEQDAADAEEYREKALALYASGETERLGISDTEYRETVERRSALERRQPAGFVAILSD